MLIRAHALCGLLVQRAAERDLAAMQQRSQQQGAELADLHSRSSPICANAFAVSFIPFNRALV